MDFFDVYNEVSLMQGLDGIDCRALRPEFLNIKTLR